MHVMNDVHGVDVNAGQPLHHSFELVDDIIEIQIFTLDGLARRAHLFAGQFIPTAVDGVKQALGQIGARAKELHLFAHQHWRNTTRDRSIISPRACALLRRFRIALNSYRSPPSMRTSGNPQAAVANTRS